MNKIVKTILSFFLCITFIFGVALIVISFFPFHELKPLFDHLAPDGDFGSLSAKHLIMLRFYGILASIASGYFYLHRRTGFQYIANIYHFLINPGIFFSFMKDLKSYATTGLFIKPMDIFALIFHFIKKLIEAAKKEDKIHSITFAIILFLAIAVRVYYLFQPLRSDESTFFTLYVYDINGAKNLSSFFQMLITDFSSSHPLYTLSSYLTYKFFGSHQNTWVIRLPSLFAGVLLVPASYMVIRNFYNKNSALLTAGIVASSSTLIFHSTNGRGYAILFLFSVLVLALAAYLKKNNNLAGWHLLSILSALGFFTILNFIFAYALVITWLIMSIIVNENNLRRTELLRNLFFSIVITVVLVIILYSPGIFLAGNLNSFYTAHDAAVAQSWTTFYYQMPISIYNRLTIYALEYWLNTTPVFLSFFSAIGFFISLIYHKKLSTNRVPYALPAIISILFILIVLDFHTPMPRYFTFLIPLCIGISSSGVLYLLRPVEQISKIYWTAIFALLVITVSCWLTVNRLSEPYITDGTHIPRLADGTPIPRYDTSMHAQVDNYDESGKYVEFQYISVSMKQYFNHLDPPRENKKVLFIFPSSSETEFWFTRMSQYCGPYYCRDIFIYDIDSYLYNDSRTCHSLYVFSNQSGTALEELLDKKGLSVSDYSDPELMHRFISANMYKMERLKDCDN